MRLLLCLCAGCLSLPVNETLAASISSLNGYVPGQPSMFEFRLPAVTNLGSYNVELLLTSSTGVAGTDFYFDASLTSPASDEYVFASTANFFTSANILPGNIHSLTLSDFSLTGVNIIPGTNDAVASIVFRTSNEFDGVLSLSLAEDTFQLDTPEITPTSVPEYGTALSIVVAEVDVSVPPVPEPSAFTLVLVAVLASLRCMELSQSRRQS